jgi:uncharacterized membrane protein
LSVPNDPMLEKGVEGIIGTLLRTGVILAALVVLAGGILYLAHNSSTPPQYRTFRGEPSELRHVVSIAHDAIHLEPLGIMQFGLLLLVATPVARVAFTVFAFGYERDWTYVVVTLIVLTLLLYSLGAWHL